MFRPWSKNWFTLCSQMTNSPRTGPESVSKVYLHFNILMQLVMVRIFHNIFYILALTFPKKHARPTTLPQAPWCRVRRPADGIPPGLQVYRNSLQLLLLLYSCSAPVKDFRSTEIVYSNSYYGTTVLHHLKEALQHNQESKQLTENNPIMGCHYLWQ